MRSTLSAAGSAIAALGCALWLAPASVPLAHADGYTDPASAPAKAPGTSADATTAVPPSDPAALRELEGYLGGLKSFEAQFTQTLTDSNARVREEASGKLYLEKPGRFRWEYSKPNRQLIVSDGRNLWLYDLDLEQVTVKPLDASLATTPALLLAGQAGVAQSFAVKSPVQQEGLKWFELVPLRQDTDFTRLRLGFAPGSGKALELSAMELQDKLNQRTLIRFSSPKRNASLRTALFSFRPPPGVDVIGSPKP